MGAFAPQPGNAAAASFGMHCASPRDTEPSEVRGSVSRNAPGAGEGGGVLDGGKVEAGGEGDGGVPDLALIADVIVGFPGETGADFQATRTLMEEARFDNAFIFKYSPRPGTLYAD